MYQPKNQIIFTPVKQTWHYIFNIAIFISSTGILNDKNHIIKNQAPLRDEMGVEHDVIPVAAEGMKKVFASVLSSPGAIVSFSRLTKTGFFRRNEVDKMKNKALLLRTVDEMSQLHFGHIDNYTIPSNNSKVIIKSNNIEWLPQSYTWLLFHLHMTYKSYYHTPYTWMIIVKYPTTI